MVSMKEWYMEKYNGCPRLSLCTAQCTNCSYFKVDQLVEMDLIGRPSIVGRITDVRRSRPPVEHMWVYIVSEGKIYNSFISNVRSAITKNDIEFYIEGSMSDE